VRSWLMGWTRINELIRRVVRAASGARSRELPRSIGIASDGRLRGNEVEGWLEREWESKPAGRR
jgi:hypothetical protein